MNCIETFELEGCAETPSNTPTTIFMFGPLPTTGSWTALGTVTCAKPDGSAQVTYYPQFAGCSKNGVATELDSYGTTPMAHQPQNGNLDDTGFVAAPTLVVANNRVGVQVTGFQGVPLVWGISLKQTNITLG